IVFPLWSSISSSYKSSNDKVGADKANDATGTEKVQEPVSEKDQALKNVLNRMMNQEKEATKQSDITQALNDESWVEAMQEGMLQFKIKKVWTLVDLPYGKTAIGTKWVYQNKKDERGIVVRNKARLVAQGNKQEEGIKYDEVFAPVARVVAIRGQIDKTLFIKRLKGDILLVQVYVDDIVFGSTKKSLCDEFKQIMHTRFQMSSMGELTFFLSLQVKQKEDGIFINQDKYVGEILKKLGFFNIRSASTPMETHKPLTKD
nr:hypothetical protein [Tanacetum cinerariifolium]